MVVLSHHHPQLAVHAVPRHPFLVCQIQNPTWKTQIHGYYILLMVNNNHRLVNDTTKRITKRRHKTKPAKLLQALRVDSWFRLQRDEPGPWSEALLWTG